MTEGNFPAIVGTLCLVLVSMIFAFLFVLAAIYMSEYVKMAGLKKLLSK
jgi:phosphate transport system permease protein